MRKDLGNAVQNVTSVSGVYDAVWAYLGQTQGNDFDLLWVNRADPSNLVFWLVVARNNQKTTYKLTSQQLFGRSVQLGKSANELSPVIYRSWADNAGRSITFEEAQKWRMALGDGSADIVELVVGADGAQSQSPFQSAISFTPQSNVKKSDLGVPILSAVTIEATGGRTIRLSDLVKNVPASTKV
jgi:hypothetical protein